LLILFSIIKLTYSIYLPYMSLLDILIMIFMLLVKLLNIFSHHRETIIQWFWKMLNIYRKSAWKIIQRIGLTRKKFFFFFVKLTNYYPIFLINDLYSIFELYENIQQNLSCLNHNFKVLVFPFPIDQMNFLIDLSFPTYLLK